MIHPRVTVYGITMLEILISVQTPSCAPLGSTGQSSENRLAVTDMAAYVVAGDVFCHDPCMECNMGLNLKWVNAA
jgi:hypothetical protein